MQNIGVVWGLGVTQSHRRYRRLIQRRIYDFLFDFNRNYASILYLFRVIGSYSLKVAKFNLLHLHLLPPYRVIKFEFRCELWCQKTRVPEQLSYSVALFA